VIRAVIVIMIVSARLGHVAGADPVREHHRIARDVSLALAIGIYGTSETVAKDSLVPAHCRWCSVDALDDAVHRSLTWRHETRAGTLSNLSAFVVAPVGMAGLLAIARAQRSGLWLDYGDDVLTVAEAAVYSQIAVQIIKLSAGRQRPEVHFGMASRLATNDDNLSFPSGHSALTFALATAAGVIAHRRNDALEPVIWATGMTLAGTTAYLRIAAGKHYLTDVAAGGAIGVVAGLVVPRLLGGLPAEVQVVPTGNGVALAGAF
jgi:membrane-associated phospholipid phosphatase